MSIQPTPLSRREAVQRMLAAAAAFGLLEQRSHGLTPVPPTLGSDPDLHKKIIPWNRILTEAEMRTVTVLADAIIPADEKSPAASAVGVPDFINEWVSAPYPHQMADREQIVPGLAWLDQEAQKRFKKSFADLGHEQISAICDDICSKPKAKPPFRKAAGFFAKFRELTAGGFYSTPEGWKDLGYIGNVPMAEFPGPPPEVLKHLGLE